MRRFRSIAPVFALLVGTGCARPETAPSCTSGSTALPDVGQRVAIESATAAATMLDHPLHGEWPAVATNGAVNLAVWWGAPGLRAARLTSEGAPIDVPARLIPSDGAFGPAVAWDGARFAIAWVDAGRGVQLTHVSSEGSLSDAPVIEIPDANVDQVRLASDGSSSTSTLLAIWTTHPAGALRGARVANDGTLLDTLPLTITSGPATAADVTWDGASFVVAWADGTSANARAARVSPAGAVLDPAGVDTVLGAGARLLGTGAGSVAAWTNGESLHAIRLSTDLAPIDPAPILVDATNPEASSITSVSLSRSANGTLVIGNLLEGDTVEDVSAVVHAYDASFQALGNGVSEIAVEAGAQAIVGLSGGAHLAVRDGDRLEARRLAVTSAGISAGAAHPIFLGPPEQRTPAVAGGEVGYLVVWTEDAKGEDRLRARFTNPEGAPSGAVFDIGATPIGAARVASSGDRFLVAWTKAGASLKLSNIARSGVVDELTLAEKLPMASGLACTEAICVVAWSELSGGKVAIRGVRLDAAGAALDHAPVTLATAASVTMAQELSVLPFEGSIAVLWSTGAVTVDPKGAVVPLSGLTPTSSDVSGLPIAAGDDRLLAVRTHTLYAEPAEQWIEIQRVSGATVGKVGVGWLGVASAVWDGAGFLVTSPGDRLFAISPNAALVGSASGLAVDFLANAALASAKPGNTLRVGTARVDEHGAERVFVQSLVRPCE